MSQFTLFPDTSYFLNYRPIHEVNWSSLDDLGNATKFKILIVPVVSRELNDKKDGGHNRSIRRRAESAIKLLDRIAEEAPKECNLTKEISAGFISSEYSDFSKYNLDSTCNDDRIILSVIHYMKETGDSNVRIIARDAGLKVKAIHHGIKCIKPPDDWSHNEPVDPETKELEKYRAQQASYPKLEVLLPGKSQHVLLEPPPSDDTFVRQCVRKIAAQYPWIEASNTLSEQGIQQYNQVLTKFYNEYALALKKWLEYKQLMSRTFCLQLEMNNNGGQPATNVSINLSFPQNVSLYQNIEKEPDMPPLPPTHNRWQAEKFAKDRDYQIFNNKEQHQQDDVNCTDNFYDRYLKINNCNVKLSVLKLQHKSLLKLPNIWVSFDDYSKANNFSINGEVIADQIQDSQSFQLIIHISKNSLESALWHIPYLSNDGQLLTNKTIQ